VKEQAAIDAGQSYDSASSSAATTLAEMGPAAAPAVPALIEALAHPAERVRVEAARALGEIGPPARLAASLLRNGARHEAAAAREVFETALRSVLGR